MPVWCINAREHISSPHPAATAVWAVIARRPLAEGWRDDSVRFPECQTWGEKKKRDSDGQLCADGHGNIIRIVSHARGCRVLSLPAGSDRSPFVAPSPPAGTSPRPNRRAPPLSGTTQDPRCGFPRTLNSRPSRTFESSYVKEEYKTRAKAPPLNLMQCCGNYIPRTILRTVFRAFFLSLRPVRGASFPQASSHERGRQSLVYDDRLEWTCNGGADQA
jgi:hypothetical protein